MVPKDTRRALLQSLGRRVARYRLQAELTQAALARSLGLSVAYVSLIERGQRNPPWTTVANLAKALGTSAAMLVE